RPSYVHSAGDGRSRVPGPVPRARLAALHRLLGRAGDLGGGRPGVPGGVRAAARGGRRPLRPAGRVAGRERARVRAADAAARRRGSRRSTLRDAGAGIRFVFAQRYLVVAVAVLFVNVLLLDPSRFVFLPLHAADPDGLGLGAAGFAWLAAAGGIGAVAGSLY